MTTTHNVYIALGSNKGDRLKHLQDAVDLIFEKLGRIEAIAKVYNTPALGFQGDDFFNSCLLLQTEYDAQTVINTLLEIEKRLGRERSSTSEYVSRTIDLDVLFFDDSKKNINTVNKLKKKYPDVKMITRLVNYD